MLTTESIWFNGKFVPWADAKIHVLTHALHYGGGAFEGIRFYKTDKGPAIFRLGEHIDRLLFSIKVLGLPFHYDKEQVMAATIETAKASKLEEGYIRPIAFYGYGKLGVNPVGNPADFVIASWPWPAYLKNPVINVKISQYIRIHPQSTTVEAKLTGNYVNNILASLELQGTHYDEVLFLDSSGFASEGAGENFFMVKNGIVYTPKLGTILPGITRRTVLEIVQKLGYESREADITREDILRADEAFFSGTAAEVAPIRSIDDHTIGNGEMGAMTAKIKEKYLNMVRGKDPEYAHYLTYI